MEQELWVYLACLHDDTVFDNDVSPVLTPALSTDKKFCW